MRPLFFQVDIAQCLGNGICRLLEQHYPVRVVTVCRGGYGEGRDDVAFIIVNRCSDAFEA